MEARVAAPKSKGRSPMNSDKNLITKKTQKKKKKQKKNHGGKDSSSEKRGSITNASPDTEEAPAQAGEGGDSDAETTASTIPLQVLPPSGPTSSPPAPVSAPPPPPHHEPKSQKPKPQTGPGVASYRPPVRVAFSNNSSGNNTVKRTDSKKLNGKNNVAQRQQRTVRISTEAFNESLRWEYALENEEDEEERLRIYKQNRRKRYLAAQNAAFPPVDNSSGGTGSSASSMSLSPSPSGDVTSLPSMMTSQLETPRSARLDDIHLDAVGCI